LTSNSEPERQPSGTQALDAALEVLLGVMHFKEPVALSELARHCGMPASNVHRYLASFQRARFVTQTGRSGKYLLGPLALELGLAAIGRHDLVNSASDGLADLRSETHMTTMLSVWGSEGATVIRLERAETPTVTSIGLGTTLPLLNSATGRIFLSWAPPLVIQSALDKELARAKRTRAIAPDIEPSKRGLDDLVQSIRERGYATVEGMFIPGLVAVSAPVLDWQGEVQAAITLMGTERTALESPDGPIARLVAFCREKSSPASLAPTVSRKRR